MARPADRAERLADIAEAVGFLASPTRAARSTGNVINVDGGVPIAYPR